MTKAPSQPKILCLGNESNGVLGRLADVFELIRPASLEASLVALESGGVVGVFVNGEMHALIGHLLQTGSFLDHLSSGFVLVGAQREVLWHNTKFQNLVGSSQKLVDRTFYNCFSTVEILGPDFCPLNTAFATNEPARSVLRVGDKTYLEVEATPIFDGLEDVPQFLALVVRDTSSEVLQRQKLNAIYQAGLELSDITPQELIEMRVEERIDLLKSKILHFTQDLLEYNTVEVRVLNRSTRQLTPLLVVGMKPEAETRVLFADPQDNGVTGFVAATGKSYLCEDTTTDPLYLQGAPEARSSLTVPLMMHDEVLGTFNVESPRPGAFSENDLQFLELFAREIAMALNTLKLLAVEKLSTATENTAMILCEVAAPVDHIIGDATWVLENTLGLERDVTERLRDILKQTREIKQLIQQVGNELRPDMDDGSVVQSKIRPQMLHKRVLVLDADDDLRRDAHELLGRFGCDVETAPDASSGFLMARSYHYDAVIADIRLPDHDGFATFSKMKEIDEHLPVILTTGYGYDPSHSIVKSRQAGLKSVLYKPFRVDQLVTELEKAFAGPESL